MKHVTEVFQVLGLSDFEAVALVRIILASVCGGLIGLEREMRGRPAGIKTFSLVCLGATLIMITNDYLRQFITYGAGDLARMPAQVVSGIGFLGAGSIMVTGHKQVKGLTTAAALWVTAAIGISIGCGFYFGSVAALCVIYISSSVYRFCDRKIMERSKSIMICVEGENEEFMLRLVQHFQEQNIRVKLLQRKSEYKWYDRDTCATIELQLTKRMLHKEVLEKIKQIEGFRYVEEI